ncbi:MAG: MCE family protein [Rhodospirillales bacterium]|nr:MCE family protein [Rhodospirillales bacterium]
MSKPANPKLIGAFVLGAIGLIIAGIVILGGGKIFQKRTPVVMFFEGAVTGLSIGSPVNFRGVRVGQVTNVYIRYQPDGKPIMEIPVLAELTGNNVQIVGPPTERKEVRRASVEQMRILVDQGLRAQLALPSLVTGQATISLDFFPNAPAEFTNAYPDRVEIPTVPSTLQEVQATLQEVYAKISQLPLDDLVGDARNLLKGANRLVNDPALSQTIVNASNALNDLQQVARTLDSRVAPLIASIETTSGTANRAMQTAEKALAGIETRSEQTFRDTNAMLQAATAALAQADRTLKTANTIIQPGGPVNFEVVNALRETAAAARSLRDLTDQLQRNPNSLLFGRPVPGGNR